jgi:hypothetical protein
LIEVIRRLAAGIVGGRRNLTILTASQAAPPYITLTHGGAAWTSW